MERTLALIAEAEAAKSYASMFTNEHGEQMVFVRGGATGVLWHSDMDWEPMEVTDFQGLPEVEVVLNDSELCWLIASWEASAP